MRPWSATRCAERAKRLLDGEGFLYLGRNYRLLIVDESKTVVALDGTRLTMSRELAAQPSRARQELLRWYRQRGREWSHGRSQPWAARLGVSEVQVVVRDLGHRWGSYHPGPGVEPATGRVNLNWTTFQLPPYLIDYVVAHELAHAMIPHHGREFWRLLGQAMPDCEDRKTQLDDLGRALWMGDLIE